MWNRSRSGPESMPLRVVAPMMVAGKNLGWITLCVPDRPDGGSWWRIALVEAIARHAALALQQSRLFEQKRIEERRKAILEEVWGLRDDTDTRAIDNFIVRLRKYIEDDPSNPRHLVTVRGIGYRFVARPE